MCLLAVLSIGTVLLPRVSYTYAKGEKEKAEAYLEKALHYSLFIAFPFALGLSAIGAEFAPLFFGSQFQVTGHLIELHAMMILPMGVNGIFGALYLLPTNQMKRYTLSVVCGLFVNVLFGFVLVWRMGVFGAVINAILTEAVVATFQVVSVSKQLDLRRLFRGWLKYGLAAVVMYAAVRLLGTITGATIGGVLLQIAVGIAIYIVLSLFLRPPAVQDLKRLLKTKAS